MIRKATAKDIPACVLMAAEFHKIAYGLHGIEFCIESTYSAFEVCLDHGLLVVADDGEVFGMAAGMKAPMIMNNACLAGAELCWWVNEDKRNTSAGLKLLKELEKCAIDEGVKVWSMMLLESSQPENIAKIYNKMGYIPAERTYMKVF